jgi:hypothetical protein
MRRDLFGRRRSDESGTNFFLSPRGRRDAAAELEATLAGFFAPPPLPEVPPEKDHPQCRFPARYAFLKEKLDFDPTRLPEQPCGAFAEWRQRVDPASITLVFASAYLNNPASTYGHTFLRLNRRGRSSREHLADTSINFAATTPTRNGIAFALLGLMGGYRGTFSALPYYMQVQKYNNLEIRDLWEYDLALSSAALDRITRHLWELGPASFRYYFLTKNCSYQLLPVLELADPHLDLTGSLRLKVVPADTVRVVARRGLVARRVLRPSAMREILARRDRLTPVELAAAEALALDPAGSPEEALSPLSQARVLESAYDLLRYKHRWARFQAPVAEEQEQSLLVRRGALPPLPAEDFHFERAVAPPHEAHPTGRVAASLGGRRGAGGFQEVTLRPALHDVLSDDRGYGPGATLEMFPLTLRRWSRGPRVSLEKLGLIEVVSLTPLDRWVKQPSWKVALSLERREDSTRRAPGPLTGRATYGRGVAVSAPRGAWAVMADGDLGAGSDFRDGYRAGAGVETRLAVRPLPAWRVLLEAGWRRYFLGEAKSVGRFFLEQSLTLTPVLEVRGRVRAAGPGREISGGVYWYL